MHANGSRAQSTAWRSALVAVDEFLGPYPALIPNDGLIGRPLTPRFTFEVLQRMYIGTVVLAAGNGRIVHVVDGQVWLVDLSSDTAVAQQSVVPDRDGLYLIDAPVGSWAVVETDYERHGECECGECFCPPVCAVCGEPVGGGHTVGCVWPYGSAAWERPSVAAAAAVLEAHSHRPACPFVRRRPGPLFDQHGNCLMCSDQGSRMSHTLTTTAGVEHHERCRTCGQVWHAIFA